MANEFYREDDRPQSNGADDRPAFIVPPLEAPLWQKHPSLKMRCSFLGVTRAGGQQSENVEIVLHERDANTVWVRERDPCDLDEDVGVDISPGDVVFLMTPISHATIHTTAEVGRTNDLLHQTRLIPVRYDTSARTTFARSLRDEEEDTGSRVHAYPGGKVVLEEGSIQLTFDSIARNLAMIEDPAPLGPTLMTWFSIEGSGAEHLDEVLYLITAARRVDAASRLLAEARTLRSELLKEMDGHGPSLQIRKLQFLGAFQQAVVALALPVGMVCNAIASITEASDPPSLAVNLRERVKEIRDALEHMDERAVGRIRRREEPSAYSIFNSPDEVLQSGILSYQQNQSSLDEVSDLIEVLRDYLKNLAISIQ